MPEPCAWVYLFRTYFDPEGTCPDEAVEGQPYCAEHGRLADG